jgi:hypothetical protein
MGEPEDPELQQFFHGAPYLEEGCVDCPPPLFLLPPPPRPPHLSQEEDCPLVASIDTCDNILILGGQVPYIFLFYKYVAVLWIRNCLLRIRIRPL